MSNFDFFKGSLRPLALYGLAANPPHRGHWACVAHLISTGFDVLIVPSFSHAFGKSMSPFETRLGWLREAAPDFLPAQSAELFFIWGVESELAAQKPVDERIYSIDVLRSASIAFGRPPALAVGPDNFDPATFSRFKDHEAISADFGLAMLPEIPGVRSTLIRDCVARGDLGYIEAWVGPTIVKSVTSAFGAPSKFGM